MSVVLWEAEPVASCHVEVLVALVAVHARDGRATVRAVAEQLGGRSVSMVHASLGRLRARGLVTWEDGRAGTLRPLVEAVHR